MEAYPLATMDSKALTTKSNRTAPTPISKTDRTVGVFEDAEKSEANQSIQAPTATGILNTSEGRIVDNKSNEVYHFYRMMFG